MALPGPKTHWRLSEIAEELENLDMSLDMDLSKDMDEFFRASSVESDSVSCCSSEASAKVNGCANGVDGEERRRRKSQTKRTRMAPNVPPPPPPTQPPPPPPPQMPPATQTPPTSRKVKYQAPKPPSTPPPVRPTSQPPPPPPLTPTSPMSSTPPPLLTTSPPPLTSVPISPPPLPPPDTPPIAPPNGYSHMPNAVSVLPPIPKLTPVTDPEDLPPPPPIFDLPEPNYAPPSPCTSPLVLSTDQPLFRLNRLTSPSPLTLSDTTSGYSTSCASSVVTSSAERTSTVYAPTSVASTSSDQPSDLSDDIEPVFEKITDEDINQVEMFYRSHKSQVYVCPGIANLYIGPARMDGSGDKWELAQTGIPVLLIDTGDARRQRKIQIILAEKGSGFILWKDTIDQLSNFKSVHSNFQSMYLSNDHTKLAGFSYDDENAASDFMQSVQEFTSDPNDEALRMGKNRTKVKKVKKQKYKAPKKTDISQPCGFVHVTKLDRSDHDQYVNQGSTPILGTRNPNNLDNMMSH